MGKNFLPYLPSRLAIASMVLHHGHRGSRPNIHRRNMAIGTVNNESAPTINIEKSCSRPIIRNLLVFALFAPSRETLPSSRCSSQKNNLAEPAKTAALFSRKFLRALYHNLRVSSRGAKICVRHQDSMLGGRPLPPASPPWPIRLRADRGLYIFVAAPSRCVENP